MRRRLEAGDTFLFPAGTRAALHPEDRIPACAAVAQNAGSEGIYYLFKSRSGVSRQPVYGRAEWK